MSEIIHGKDLIIKIDGTAVAGARSCDIHVQDDAIEVSSPESGKFREYIAGRMGWGVTTNHLVKNGNTINILKMAGKMVSLAMTVRDPSALPFNGFVEGTISILEQSATFVSSILYNPASGRFVARVMRFGQDPLYYATWLGGNDYYAPASGAVFECENRYYRWEEGSGLQEVESSEYRIGGSALCQQTRVVGTVGNLAQGSFSFLGSGPLE